MPPQYDYDLLVIGSGPAGHRAAIQAAKLDRRVAIVEKQTVVGGVCINTGTIPSKTLREAALRLSGYRERGIAIFPEGVYATGLGPTDRAELIAAFNAAYGKE